MRQIILAINALLKFKAYTLINVLGLACSLACVLTVARYILSLIHISEPTRQAEISYAVFCLKKKNKKTTKQKNKKKKTKNRRHT